MSADDIKFIVLLGGFFVTIGTFIWRMAILHHQCGTNKDSLLRAHERIDKLEENQSNKINEISIQMQTMKETQIRMEEKLNLLLELKKEAGKSG